jgi:hypothetical protein
MLHLHLGEHRSTEGRLIELVKGVSLRLGSLNPHCLSFQPPHVASQLSPSVLGTKWGHYKNCIALSGAQVPYKNHPSSCKSTSLLLRERQGSLAVSR